MRRRWRKRRQEPDTDINITAFMNLMVILVPFLLITAVFSRITILDLNLPAEGGVSEQQVQKPTLQLEVIARADRIEIGDRTNGLLKAVDIKEDGSHLHEISELLQQIKARHPDKQDISLLLEADTAYEKIVDMMDTLRVALVDRNGRKNVRAELFPIISVGDAPARKKRIASRKNL